MEQEPSPEPDILDDCPRSCIVASYPGGIEVHSRAKAEPAAKADIAASADCCGKSSFAGVQGQIRSGSGGSKRSGSMGNACQSVDVGSEPSMVAQLDLRTGQKVQ